MQTECRCVHTQTHKGVKLQTETDALAMGVSKTECVVYLGVPSMVVKEMDGVFLKLTLYISLKENIAIFQNYGPMVTVYT